MGINFKVAMVLEAVNRMDGGIRGAMNSVGRLRRSFADAANETARMNPVAGWSERIGAVTRSMEAFGRRARSIRNDAEQSMMNGMKEIAAGTAIAMPVIGPVKQAADVQTNWTTMRTMGISSDELSKIKENTLRLSQGLTFDYAQVQGVALAINKAGVNGDKLLKMQETATEYSQLEYYRYGSDPNQTATHLAHIAESAGALRVDKYEKEKYGLRSQDDIDKFVVKKFNNLAEVLNKVVSITSSDTSRFAESVKYSMPEAKSLGWSEASALLMTGIYSRFGIEGSMSGTHLKDFASRLNPYQHYIGEDVEKRSNRLTAMQEAGWLEGAQWTTTKTGHKKFSSAGKSVFHNEDGTLKEPEKIFAEIYKAYERFEKAGKRLQFHGILQDVLGEQGKDIANLLNQNPEIFKHIAEDMEKPMSMQDALTERANDTNAQWDIFSGNIKTAGKMMGDLVLGDITNELKWINSLLFNSEEGKKSPVFQWIEDNKELIKWTMKATLVVAGLVVGVGALKIAGAILSFGFIAPLATLCGWLMRSKNALSVFHAAYKIARLTGLGFGSSITKGLTAVSPFFGKLASGAKWVGSIFKGMGARGMLFSGKVLLGGAKGAIQGIRSVLKFAGSIGKAFGRDSLIAVKVFGSIGKAAGRFVAKWLVHAARIAAGWLIAMGPPGWIILGVTALIVAGVVAWKTNFMGFRDKCISCWSAIQDWGGRTWRNICDFVGGAMGKVGGFIDRVKEALGLASELDQQPHTWGPIKGAEIKLPHEKAPQIPAKPFDARLEVRGQSKPGEQPFRFMGNKSHYRVERPVSHLVRPVIQLPEKKVDRERKAERPFAAPPMIARQQSDFRQVNNFTVKSNGEAAEIAKRVVPKKYTSEDNNPRNLTPVMV